MLIVYCHFRRYEMRPFYEAIFERLVGRKIFALEVADVVVAT
jgi:hypothetical protein